MTAPSHAPGEIVTFYSFKGGVGRTMLLANVAWLFAARGRRVLMVDWDLEAPGLHRYFFPFLSDPDLRSTRGLLDLLGDYIAFVQTKPEDRPDAVSDPLALADPERVAARIEFQFEEGGSLHFIGAGRQDGGYAARVNSFDWAAFYQRFSGGAFIDRLAGNMRAAYDLVLIDGRTGVADSSGICTLQLPDRVALFFTYNRQSVEGTAAVAKLLAESTRPPRLTFRPTRVVRDIEGLTDARDYARERLDRYLRGEAASDPEAYWAAAEIPHYPAYGFEETLATFRERAGGRNNLLADTEWLARELANGTSFDMPKLPEGTRQLYLHRFKLRDPDKAALDELRTLEPTEALARLAKLVRRWKSERPNDRHLFMRVVDTYEALASDLALGSGRGLAVRGLVEAEGLLMTLSGQYADDFQITARASDLAIRRGDLLVTMGSLGEASKAFDAALRLDRRLSEAEPDNAGWQRDLSVSWNRLGDGRQAQGDLIGALQAYGAAHAIADRLAASDPGNAEWQRDLSVSWNTLGEVRQAQGDLTGALQAYEAAHAIAQRLAASDPANAGWQRDLIVSHGNIAAGLEELVELVERRGDAPVHWGEALRIAPELAASGRLAPTDSYLVEELEQRLATSESEQP